MYFLFEGFNVLRLRMQRTEEQETVRMLHPCQLASWVDLDLAVGDFKTEKNYP